MVWPASACLPVHPDLAWQAWVGKRNTHVILTGSHPYLEAMMKPKVGRTLVVEGKQRNHTGGGSCVERLGLSPSVGRSFHCETHTTLHGVPVPNSRSGRRLGRVAFPTVQRQP